MSKQSSVIDAGSVKREGGFVVIRVPIEEAHGLRVALAPCPCKGAKSISTASIRWRLAKALGKVV